MKGVKTIDKLIKQTRAMQKKKELEAVKARLWNKKRLRKER